MADKEDDAGQLQAQMEEINLHCHLRHKNIVQYYGASTEEDTFKIFMELVPGGTYVLLSLQQNSVIFNRYSLPPSLPPFPPSPQAV